MEDKDFTDEEERVGGGGGCIMSCISCIDYKISIHHSSTEAL